MVLRFEIFVPATSTFEINRNDLISNKLLEYTKITFEAWFEIMK